MGLLKARTTYRDQPGCISLPQIVHSQHSFSSCGYFVFDAFRDPMRAKSARRELDALRDLVVLGVGPQLKVRK